MMKALRGFWSSLKKTYSILTGNFDNLNFQEACECFKGATHARKEFLKLETFTDSWERCFHRWLGLCKTKEECMDPFFTAFGYGYSDERGKWAPNPLREAAAMKWLELISRGPITRKDESHIWNLSNNNWGQGERVASYHVAHALRDRIAREKIETTDDPEALNRAINYASSEELKLAGIEKRNAIRKDR